MDLKKTIYVIIPVLLLLSLSFAVGIGKGEAKAVAIVDSQAVFKINTSTQTKNLIANKLNSKSYEIKLEEDKLFDFEVKNRISADNTLLDCGILTCDFVLEINPAQAMRFDSEQINGGWQFGTASVKKVFFYENESYTHYEPIYSYSTKEVCTESNETNSSVCNNITTSTQSGTNTTTRYRIIEQTDFSKLTLKSAEKTKIIIRFAKPSPTEKVDIYPEIFGHKFTDWAWWNAYTKRLTINISGLTNNQYNITIETNISINRTYTDLNDFRMTYKNSSGSEEEIGFWRHSELFLNSSGTNNASGTILFKLPVLFTGSNNNTAYLYYNKSGQTDVSNLNNATLIGDEFFGSALNTTLWSERNAGRGGASSSVSSGAYTSSITSSPIDYGHTIVLENKQAMPTTNYSVTAKMKTITTTSGGGGGSSGIGLAFGYPVMSNCEIIGGGVCQTFLATINSQKGGNYPPSNATQSYEKRGYTISIKNFYSVEANQIYIGMTSVTNETWKFTKNSTHVISGGNNTFFRFSNGTQSNLTTSVAIPAAHLSNNFSFVVNEYSRADGTTGSLDYIYATLWTETSPVVESITEEDVLQSITPSILNTTNGTTFYTENTLYGWANLSDKDNGYWNITYKWFVNDTLNATGEVNNYLANSSGIMYNIANISPSDTSVDDTWILQLNATNQTKDIDATNSSPITITNTPPVIGTLSTTITGNLVTASVTGTDIDNQTLTGYYYFETASGSIQDWSTNSNYIVPSTNVETVTIYGKVYDGSAYSANTSGTESFSVASVSETGKVCETEETLSGVTICVGSESLGPIGEMYGINLTGYTKWYVNSSGLNIMHEGTLNPVSSNNSQMTLGVSSTGDGSAYGGAWSTGTFGLPMPDTDTIIEIGGTNPNVNIGGITSTTAGEFYYIEVLNATHINITNLNTGTNATATNLSVKMYADPNGGTSATSQFTIIKDHYPSSVTDRVKAQGGKLINITGFGYSEFDFNSSTTYMTRVTGLSGTYGHNTTDNWCIARFTYNGALIIPKITYYKNKYAFGNLYNDSTYNSLLENNSVAFIFGATEGGDEEGWYAATMPAQSTDADCDSMSTLSGNEFLFMGNSETATGYDINITTYDYDGATAISLLMGGVFCANGIGGTDKLKVLISSNESATWRVVTTDSTGTIVYINESKTGEDVAITLGDDTGTGDQSEINNNTAFMKIYRNDVFITTFTVREECEGMLTTDINRDSQWSFMIAFMLITLISVIMQFKFGAGATSFMFLNIVGAMILNGFLFPAMMAILYLGGKYMKDAYVGEV